jgi:hypothetical protein
MNRKVVAVRAAIVLTLSLAVGVVHSWSLALRSLHTWWRQPTPKDQAIAVVRKWESYLQAGATGESLWRYPEIAQWPLALRSCRVLAAYDFSDIGDSKSAIVVMRIESSTRGGFPITSVRPSACLTRATVGRLIF